MSAGRRAATRSPVVWAIVMAVLAAVFTIAGLATRLWLPTEWLPSVPATADAAAGLTFPAAGAFLVAHRPRHLLAWLMCTGGLACSLFVVGEAGMLALAAAGQVELAAALRVVATLARLSGGVLLATLLPLYAPDGRLPSPGWRVLVRLAWALFALEVVRAAIRPPIKPHGTVVPNPLAVDAFAPYAPAAVAFTTYALQATVVAALVSLALRARRADPLTRRQIAWPLGLYALYVVCLVGGPAFWIPILVTTGLIPFAMALSVLRHRLFDLDELVGRAVIAGGVLVAVGAIYLGVSAAASVLVSGYGSVAGLAAALLAGAFFHPLRVRLRRLVDQAMYGRHGDPRRLAGRLAAEVRESDPVAALASVAMVTRDGLGVSGLAVEVAGGRGVSFGDLGPSPREVPLIWHGEIVGRLRVGPPGSRRFSREYTDRLLGVAKPYVSDVVHAVRMSADLQRSRERILAAREEERRRLRRDLHDGLGQALGGLAMSLNIATVSLRTSPAAADRLLTDLREGMDGVAQEVRELVYGLSPPLLDRLGLEGAVRELAGASVTVSCPGPLGELPVAVEVAAFRIVQEALTNVARHAGQARAWVSLRLDGAALVVVVDDDGPGIPPNRRAGVGLSSMRERAAELGGSCATAGRPGGGTRVEAVLPHLSSL
ncbi:sensor histidine kinase [Nonomuraea sp. NBC_01738]|uniref:sensor histidine kinase n=1 Tax=Nonomuraea sp. NBC_01738 TaxID=2976003 RepID=UPI002E121D49|nr:sensor histidine kinase [Nonomuraea sp. NBC_01738]